MLIAFCANVIKWPLVSCVLRFYWAMGLKVGLKPEFCANELKKKNPMKIHYFREFKLGYYIFAKIPRNQRN